MYLKKIYKAGRTVEVHDSYSPRYGKHITRGGAVGPTPEAMANYNDKLSKRRAIRTMNDNFQPGDTHAVLSYYKGQRPSPEEAAQKLTKALRQIRDLMRRPEKWQKRRSERYAGATTYPAKELKYMKATGIGSRGGIHHHVVLNTNDLEMLREVWPWGPVHVEPLDSDGNYARLARYFCGQGKTEPGGSIAIHGNRWSGSRNLRQVKPTLQKIDAVLWREPPRPPKGYLIDPDSIDAGVNPHNGMPYLFYRMVELCPLRVPGKTAAQVLSDLQQANHASVRHVWTEKYSEAKLRNTTRRKKTRKGGPPHEHHDPVQAAGSGKAHQ